MIKQSKPLEGNGEASCLAGSKGVPKALKTKTRELDNMTATPRESKS